MPHRNRAPLPYDFLPPVPSFTVVSNDMEDGGRLDNRQLFNGMGVSGENISPHLRWEGFPPETEGFAVTCFDPDAPTGSGFWHWLLFDVPGDVTELAAGAGSGDGTSLPAGAIHGRGDFGTRDYGGAAPPEGHGEHRYVFAVHALATRPLGANPDGPAAPVGFQITSATLARGLLVARYEH